jgi:hypothetical protein
VAMDLGIFKALVGSQTPKTASDLAEAVGADEVLLGIYAGAILIPLLTSKDVYSVSWDRTAQCGKCPRVDTLQTTFQKHLLSPKTSGAWISREAPAYHLSLTGNMLAVMTLTVHHSSLALTSSPKAG